jgi:hypothetical protein
MDVVQVLRSERSRVAKELHALNTAIKALGGTSSGGRHTTKHPTLSAAARGRIAAAQRARWAKVKGISRQKQNAVSVPAKKKIMSPAARRKIAAAQRARWAKVRAGKAK